MVIYPSQYTLTLETASYNISLADFLTLRGATYTVDEVWAVIPVGGRKSGSANIYHAIFDGTYIRCNAEIGAVFTMYIFHGLFT
jgi:hypothetical protein